MSKLKPWAAGPFELIRHADGHLKAGSDFDKRMALISYDNAIEVSVTTFLQLHPSQRGGRTYERKKTDDWLSNYHKKLEFLESFAKERNVSLAVSIDEIIFYHNLRNELYHSGNGLVPELNHLGATRNAALSVFTCLFDIDPEELLKAEQLRIKADSHPILSAQSAFLEAFIELEKTLKATLHATGAVDQVVLKSSMRSAWRSFAKKIDKMPKNFGPLVDEATTIRNAIVHGEPTGIDERKISELTKALEKITEFVSQYSISVDILPDLRSLYPDWIRNDLTAVRIIQKDGRAFLETTIRARAGAVRDEKIERADLGFISEESYSETNMFSTSRTAAENAEKFLEEMDPYSLMMITDLFGPSAQPEIIAKYGLVGGDQKSSK